MVHCHAVHTSTRCTADLVRRVWLQVELQPGHLPSTFLVPSMCGYRWSCSRGRRCCSPPTGTTRSSRSVRGRRLNTGPCPAHTPLPIADERSPAQPCAVQPSRTSSTSRSTGGSRGTRSPPGCTARCARTYSSTAPSRRRPGCPTRADRRVTYTRRGSRDDSARAGVTSTEA